MPQSYELQVTAFLRATAPPPPLHAALDLRWACSGGSRLLADLVHVSNYYNEERRGQRRLMCTFVLS